MGRQMDVPRKLINVFRRMDRPPWGAVTIFWDESGSMNL